MRQLPFFVLVLAMTALAGCTPWATYPPIEGAASINDPQFAPIPELMAEAIAYGSEHYGLDPVEGEPIVYNLPPNTAPRVYERVTDRLGDARPMVEGDDHAYHVTSVRVRTTNAQVDLICPRSDGHHELVEISFKQTFTKGYEVRDARLWRVHVEVPEPNFVPYPQPEEDTAVATEPTETDE
jgi:hypothetical protein